MGDPFRETARRTGNQGARTRATRCESLRARWGEIPHQASSFPVAPDVEPPGIGVTAVWRPVRPVCVVHALRAS
jgi:hypothetical protein